MPQKVAVSINLKGAGGADESVAAYRRGATLRQQPVAIRILQHSISFLLTCTFIHSAVSLRCVTMYGLCLGEKASFNCGTFGVGGGRRDSSRALLSERERTCGLRAFMPRRKSVPTQMEGFLLVAGALVCEHGCGYVSRVVSRAHKHRDMHASGKTVFSCYICGWASVFRPNLNRHVASKHPFQEHQQRA